MTNLEDLLEFGRMLDLRPGRLGGESVGTRMARGMLRVRDREGRDCRLAANAVQLAYEARRGRQNIVLKARQMGLTTWIAGRFFLKTVTHRGVLSVQVAHTREAAESIFRTAARMWEALPPQLRRGPLRRGLANVGQMTFPVLDSEFRVLSAADPNAGRGLTIQNLHCSELSRWPGDAAATLAGLRAALAPGGESCLESTPAGAHGCFYEEWQRGEACVTGPGLTRHFFPWWMEPAYVAEAVADASAEERALMMRHGLTAAQIGFRRGLERSYRGLRLQEFAEDAESCFKASGECCFEIAAIERRLAEVTPAVEERRGGALRIWLPAVARRAYLLGVDTAGGGVEGDFAAVQVIDRDTGLQCAELCERLTPLALARAAAALGREYGGAEIAVERNNHGAAVLAYLDAVEHYARVYAADGQAGWLTSAGSKPRMIARLGSLLEGSPELMQSARLLAECRSYVALGAGRTGAASGAHDDCLMAMAIAQAVRAESGKGSHG